MPIIAVKATSTSDVVVACFGRLPGGVDERGDGEDRATAAESAERHADEEPERGGEQGAHDGSDHARRAR